MAKRHHNYARRQEGLASIRVNLAPIIVPALTTIPMEWLTVGGNNIQVYGFVELRIPNSKKPWF
uniref:Uncharacterized protein n=1 Tax=Oryza sativa subsp. japonica TaxID=39947 RepID=Q69N35_ORYSJ|nr:hypothetical protein [Oryza sativa Japonica Group]